MFRRKSKITKKADGLYLAKNQRATGNTLIMGKGNVLDNFILPNMINNENNENFVIVDPDGELYEKTKDRLEEAGYDVIYFNPEDENTRAFSPIRYFMDTNDKIQLSEYLSSEIISESNCTYIKRLLLKSALLYMSESGDYIGENAGLYQLLEILKDYDNWRMAVDNMRCLCYMEKGFGKYISEKDIVFLNSLSTYAVEQAIRELREDLSFLCTTKSKELTHNTKTIRVYTEFNTKTALFICPSTTNTQYNFLCRMLLQRCVDECKKRVASMDGDFTFARVNFLIQDIKDMIVADTFKPYGWREDVYYADKYNMAFYIITDTIDNVGQWALNVTCLIENYLLFPNYDRYSYKETTGNYPDKSINILNSDDIRTIPNNNVLVNIEGQKCQLAEMLNV